MKTHIHVSVVAVSTHQPLIILASEIVIRDMLVQIPSCTARGVRASSARTRLNLKKMGFVNIFLRAARCLFSMVRISFNLLSPGDLNF